MCNPDYIYAATQGMRAYNNNKMRKPSLHPLVLGYAYYCCMPSSPMLLHMKCYGWKRFDHKDTTITFMYAQVRLILFVVVIRFGGCDE